MERRDAFFVLLVLGAGGYVVHRNWDEISERLGLEQLDPQRLKAIDLAKDSGDLGGGITSWRMLLARKARREIDFVPDPWEAIPLGGKSYRVVVRWTDLEEETKEARSWRVDIASSQTAFDGPYSEPAAAPR